jgi:acyl-CoA reductase-like NAD-dependent aldehyde dehydrogenase
VQAAHAARAAQAEWAALPAPQRGQVIANLGRLMTANKERLAWTRSRGWSSPWRPG